MNLRFLKTIIAISQHPTLAAAAKSVHLSHSAVSLQVQSLEDELQIQILDRSRRPPVLTDQGYALVDHAKRMQLIADDIQALGDGQQIHGNVMIGAVPSTVTHLIAPALAVLNRNFPTLRVELDTGLSGPLIQKVLDRDIVSALVTEPNEKSDELLILPICSEPFELVVSASEETKSLKELLTNRPFVWFDRRSWLSRQVETFLITQKIHVQTVMETSSIEAVEALVAHGLGVSILPRRAHVPIPLNVRYLPLWDSQVERRLALVTRKRSPRPQITAKLVEALQGVVQ